MDSDSLLQSRETNNPPTEGTSSWLGCSDPPEDLNEVPVEAPAGIFTAEELTLVDSTLAHMAGAVDGVDVARLWVEALALACTLYSGMF